VPDPPDYASSWFVRRARIIVFRRERRKCAAHDSVQTDTVRRSVSPFVFSFANGLRKRSFTVCSSGCFKEFPLGDITRKKCSRTQSISITQKRQLTRRMLLFSSMVARVFHSRQSDGLHNWHVVGVLCLWNYFYFQVQMIKRITK